MRHDEREMVAGAEEQAQLTALFDQLRQLWPMPSAPRPITVIGAGGIVSGAHLPAYRKWGLPVAGIYDRDIPRAQAVAKEFSIRVVHTSLEEALNAKSANTFDIALPPQALGEVLPRLPENCAALIQKPFGVDLVDARTFSAVLAARNITAATNFQLRFTPSMLAIGDAIAKGLLGSITEIEVRLACRTPWEEWPFLSELDAVEIPLHSIHYLDWIRSVLGQPKAVYAKSVRHPDHPTLKDARSSVVLDFGDNVRCCLSLNHTHNWGPQHEEATLRIEGTRGAAIAGLGYLVNYPDGTPETLDMIEAGGRWTSVSLKGARTPDSFAAVMANLQRFVAGEDDVLQTSVADSVATMALVDGCLRSNACGEAVSIEDTQH